ncbi:OsmC family peroxiredoxin [uncultured Thiodictyon sp.]|jgi:hypothetical protein|uniref:OsmC family protein n=1 Tax=uncultured Thiodictyon sp. TaxID=1846217 RepID=UPI0025E61545|nr:OsmC family peroxiredoxin [uncultured Thiodictyon sp.]
MKSEDLRSIQAPLKERYRDTPVAALMTLRAHGRIGAGLSCKIDTGQALRIAGLHPATGGSGHAACSGDMLLEALVACAGVTLNAVATALGIALRDASLLAEGDLDFRGTLGLSKEVPVGFQSGLPTSSDTRMISSTCQPHSDRLACTPTTAICASASL